MFTLFDRAQGILWLVGCIAVIGLGLWMVTMLFPKRSIEERDQFDPHSKPGGEVRPKDGAALPLLGYAMPRTETDRKKNTKRGEKQ